MVYKKIVEEKLGNVDLVGVISDCFLDRKHGELFYIQ